MEEIECSATSPPPSRKKKHRAVIKRNKTSVLCMSVAFSDDGRNSQLSATNLF